MARGGPQGTLSRMEIAEHIAALRREGAALAASADAAGLAAEVPSCPGWTVADLLRHTGGVHRWAAANVTRGGRTPMTPAEKGSFMESSPGDTALLDWFRHGHAVLVDLLAGTDPEWECWSFLPSPSPLAFWARRQAHETTIHRADADLAAGIRSDFAPGLAADGIDELVCGFAVQPGERLHRETVRTVAIIATDTGDTWTAAEGPEGFTARRGSAAATASDCTLSGPAARLYTMLWNRTGDEGIDVAGDATFPEHWRASMRVRWS